MVRTCSSGRSRTGRVIMPGLAEAAAPGAAPEHLDVQPVVHDLGERHELVLRVGPVAEVGDRALLDPLGHVGVARRDRHQRARRRRRRRTSTGTYTPGDRGQLPQHPLARARRCARRPSTPGSTSVISDDDLLAVADHEDVDEVGEGLGVEGAVAAGADERVLRAPLGRPHGHAGQVDAVEDVGVDELGREVEGDAGRSRRPAGGCRPEQRQAVRRAAGPRGRPTARRSARRRRRRARSGSRRGSAAPGWAGRSRRRRGRRGARPPCPGPCSGVRAPSSHPM